MFVCFGRQGKCVQDSKREEYKYRSIKWLKVDGTDVLLSLPKL